MGKTEPDNKRQKKLSAMRKKYRDNVQQKFSESANVHQKIQQSNGQPPTNMLQSTTYEDIKNALPGLIK